MMYRKRPVWVHAMQLPPVINGTTAPGIMDWLEGRTSGCAWTVDRDGVTITTLEGDMLARPGDWIIQGVKGELYPCKPEIFAETYEAGEAGSDTAALFREER